MCSLDINSNSPYCNTIADFLELLENANIVNSFNKEQAFKIAIDYLRDNSDCIAIIWNVDDVLEIAKEKNIKLSHSEALDILDYIESNHDANYGINWTTIDCALNYYHSSNEETN